MSGGVIDGDPYEVEARGWERLAEASDAGSYALAAYSGDLQEGDQVRGRTVTEEVARKLRGKARLLLGKREPTPEEVFAAHARKGDAQS